MVLSLRHLSSLIVLFTLLLPPARFASLEDDPLADEDGSADESGRRFRAEDVVASFGDDVTNGQFSHLAIDASSAMLYVGGTNALYELSGDLRQVAHVVTGPVMDSPFCKNDQCLPSSAASANGSLPKRLTDNTNQILLVHPSRRQLIACGSVFQGSCKLFTLANLSVEGTPSTVAVAANAPNASTMAFFGDDGETLFVGATFSFSAYRTNFPAVATRRLDRFDLVYPPSIDGQSAMIVSDEFKQDFRISYVGGFASQGFAYWATVQRSSVQHGSPLVSKLVRVCERDKKYETYAEIPLECIGADNEKYPIVQAIAVGRVGSELLRTMPAEWHPLDHPEMEFLVGVFAKEKASKSEPTMAKSAVCLFPMKNVRASFQLNIQRCNIAIGTVNLAHFGKTAACVKVDGDIPEDFCEHALVGGTEPVTQVALVAFDAVTLTSVAIDVVDGRETVLFLGTQSGTLKKVLVTSRTEGHQYAEMAIAPGLPIAKDMVFDRSHEHLYVMVRNKVYKVRTRSCSKHTQCSTCTQSGDPYCGWCTLDNKCSVQSECANAQNDSTRWLSQGHDRCPRIVEMTPRNASKLALASTTVEVKFSFLPKLRDPNRQRYQCVFDEFAADAHFISPATLRCALPPPNARSAIPTNKDHVSIPLKFQLSDSHRVFHEDRFIFFDCSQHRLCTACVASDWQCDWCLHSPSSCLADGAYCPKQPIIANARRNSTILRGGALPPSSCPQIASRPTDVRVPSDVETPIRLSVKNFDKVVDGAQSEVECAMQISETNVRRVRGRLLGGGNEIECDAHTYSYENATPTRHADLQIMLKNGYVVDKIKVQLYKCALLADDCSSCFMLDSAYSCVWCSGSCQHENACPTTPAHDVETSATTCPEPSIESVFPLVGPREGATRVVLRGHEFGTKIDDVRDKVTVGGRPCKVVRYEVSKRIECLTSASNDVGAGSISVLIGDKKVTAKEEFQYVDPRIFSFAPNVGPQSGGTKIRIEGEHLNVSSTLSVFLGSLPCRIDDASVSVTDRSIVCTTSAAPRSNLDVANLLVQLDAANRTVIKSFVYMSDPTIASIEPLETFMSGGRLLTVRGNFFDSIQVPKMHLVSLFNGAVLSESVPCHVLNRTFMTCPSPSMLRRADSDTKSSPPRLQSRHTVTTGGTRPPIFPPEFNAPPGDEKPDLSAYEKVGVGFMMDAVEGVRNLSDRFRLTLTPDPEYFAFPEGRKMNRGDFLVLDGRNLNLASRAQDVHVFVGGEVCHVTVVTSAQLLCSPPGRRPRSASAAASDSVGEPFVTVRIGNLEFRLGQLLYDAPAASALLSPAVVGGAVAAGAFLLLVGVVLIAVWWRRKSFKAEKEYKRIQLQMDNLESNVRNECKQAFAELQTDMTDLTADLIAIGIPFHQRRVYASKVLFREEHSVMLDWQSTSNGYGSASAGHIEEATAQFELLLRNRQFIFVLVDTLERQPSFGAQDRVYVASLLTAALAHNMQYCTDVVLTLLTQLVRKSVESRCPQLMLRRTESVVEKMLANWMALCLYDYLHEYAGESLFLLFKALKQQIDKGPVDAVTGDARYSLSEDRLLKEQVQQQEAVLLHIIPPTELEPDEKLFCRVLNCDTISQVKAKLLDTLYKHAPFSSRPSIHDVDLEWRHSPSGHVLLQDDDRTSPQSKDGWRRLNTLAHYGVSGQAIVAIFPKNRQASFSYTNCSNQTYASIASSTLLLRNSPENVEHGVRYWHLVKPADEHGGGAGSGGRHATLSSSASIAEIYLTRLLATKGTVQKFIDDFFRSILAVNRQHFPPVVKYLFDFFEEQASIYQVADSSVVYAWKNNSLPLRFWVNVIKNPDFVFDVEKSSTVDSCLSVIAQTFMDSCSTTEHRLGKDSPSNKLLFARDLPRYRDTVARFYSDVRQLPAVSEQELSAHMAALSKSYAQEFNVVGSIRELMAYSIKFNEEIVEALESDPIAKRANLGAKLEKVFNLTAAAATLRRH